MPRLLVAGPPCGGKTTYARQQLHPGESLLDFDDIIEEVGLPRYSEASPVDRVLQAYDLWVKRLPHADVVVWTAPKRTQRGRFRSQYRAQVVVVMADIQTCLDRAKAERPAPWMPAISAWFRAWEPSRSGKETIVRSEHC